MAISVPCDACGRQMRDSVVNVWFSTNVVVSTGGGRTKYVATGRPTEYLLCEACASYLDVGLRDAIAGVTREHESGARDMARSA